MRVSVATAGAVVAGLALASAGGAPVVGAGVAVVAVHVGATLGRLHVLRRNEGVDASIDGGVDRHSVGRLK